MPANNIATLLDQQRNFFLSGATLAYDFRIAQLQTLKTILQKHESEIAAALKKDLHKPTQEGIFHEIFLVLTEINHALKHLKSWMQAKKVRTLLPLWPGQSKIVYEPYGTALIIGPWNYPFLLLMQPLVGAICAGNCVILKPSELARHTEHLIHELIAAYFSEHYIAAISADAKAMPTVLEAQFDYIFFTGGTKIGKLIMQAAANHLTPVTLELGGKSPCIVDKSAQLGYAARRIAWAKTCNAGQTCIAPDYVLIERSCKDEFVQQLTRAFTHFYGQDPMQSADYGRIINEKHFTRLLQLLNQQKIIYGGQSDKDQLYLAPTILDEVSWQDPIMQEEIFGPILPILTFDNFDEVITKLKVQEKPLALYLFSNDKNHQQQIMQHISFGNGCINDCLVQILNYPLPFGGVGASGMGQYHGRYSFETFSHRKSIYRKLINFDIKLEYPPYSDGKLAWLKKIMRV